MLKKSNVRIAILLLATCVCLPFFSLADQKTYEGPGWDTPEDAVAVYLEGLREQDIDKMISAYTVETCIDQFDMKAQLQRMRAYLPSMAPSMPNANPLVRALNIEARKYEISRSILRQMLSICPLEQDVSEPIVFTGENMIQEMEVFVDGLQRAFHSVDVSGLNLLTFIPPELVSEIYLLEKNQQNILAQGAPYGAEEVRSVVAIFGIDSRICVLCCDAARYSDRWYMLSPGGNIAQLIGLSPMTGGMVTVVEGGVAAMVNGLWPFFGGEGT